MDKWDLRRRYDEYVGDRFDKQRVDQFMSVNSGPVPLQYIQEVRVEYEKWKAAKALGSLQNSVQKVAKTIGEVLKELNNVKELCAVAGISMNTRRVQPPSHGPDWYGNRRRASTLSRQTHCRRLALERARAPPPPPPYPPPSPPPPPPPYPPPSPPPPPSSPPPPSPQHHDHFSPPPPPSPLDYMAGSENLIARLTETFGDRHWVAILNKHPPSWSEIDHRMYLAYLDMDLNMGEASIGELANALGRTPDIVKKHHRRVAQFIGELVLWNLEEFNTIEDSEDGV